MKMHSGDHAARDLPAAPGARHSALADGGARAGGAGLTFWVQWGLAVPLLIATLFLLASLKNGEVAAQYRVLALVFLLLSAPAYSLLGVYDKRHGLLTGLLRLFAGWGVVLAVLAVAGFVTKTGALFSREVMLQWSVLGLLVQALAFLPVHHSAQVLERRLRARRRALVVGCGDLARRLADNLVTNCGEAVVGMVRAGPEEAKPDMSYRLMGELEDLSRIIAECHINRLYLALPLTESQRIRELYIELLDSSVDVVWVPDLESLLLLNHSVSSIAGMPAIHLNESPLTAYPSAALLKSMLDKTVAALAIVLLSPLLLMTAAAVKFSSPGPVLFKQQRHGWNGRVFMMYKFRSMRVHQDAVVSQAKRSDPRVTRVGALIRRTSIDELPQLFNVLQGHMSLVGPRPHAVAHNNYYTGKIDAYMARHRIKPGITGLAQVSGCRGETETLEKMARRVELDLIYINNWSIWQDIRILAKTPFTLLSRDVY